MKVRTKVVKTYHCDICNTGYPKPQEAKNCEQHAVEELVAKIGDNVRLKGKRECLVSGPRKNPHYVASGVITEISQPLPYDMEYELKWLGGKGRVHRRGYLVSYKCPKCNERRSQSAFAPEFVILKKTTPKKRTAFA